MTTPLVKKRIDAIDMMRGLVILIMLLDHVRERFYYHVQVSDPMDISVTDPGLFFSRLAAHFCAPVFVFLTGLSA
nr:heparan-alpha-glucosaminide N-acetyltransferase domain-containing protein [Rheinheimera oceanensis]